MNAYIVTALVISQFPPNVNALTWDGPEGAEVLESSVIDLTVYGEYALEKLANLREEK